MDSFDLPGYDVGEMLGFGAHGEVWRARERATGDLVALKRLRPDITCADATEAVEGLCREAALLAAVGGEHVVRLRGVVPVDAGLVLVLDYAAGGSLASLIAVRRLLPGEVVTVGVPLAQTLAEIHARGLVHGDLAPGNVLFTAEGKPLLADLGVARLLGTPPEWVSATPGFADPAVLAGAAPSPASDVYALAAVCHVALTGGPPGATAARDHGDSAAAALLAVLRSALDTEPARRPDAATLARRLYDTGLARPVRLALPTPPPATPPPATPPPATPPPAVTARIRRPAPAGGSIEPVLHGTAGTDDTGGGHVIAGRHAARPAAGPARRRVLVVTAGVAVGLMGLAAAVGTGLAWAAHDTGKGGPAHLAIGTPAIGTPAIGTPAIGTPAIGTPAGLSGAAPPPPAASSSVPPSAGPDRSSGRNPAVTDIPDVDWAAVLRQLDGRRDRAFSSGDAAALDTVYVPGAADLAADRRTLGQLIAEGGRARGLAPQLDDVSAVGRSADRVTLEVIDELPAYDVVYPGDRVEHHAARGPCTWSVVLAPAAGDTVGWRIATIAAGSPAGPR